MTDYPYTKVPGNLKKFLGIIQSSGVPSTVNLKTLITYGLKSTNDRPIVNILKFIGFVASDGIPTDAWKNYRNREIATKVLGSSIKSAYSDLFQTFPDAYRKDNEALRNYFSVHTSVGEQSISAMVSTFKALCELATFPEDEKSEMYTENEEAKTPTPNQVSDSNSIPLNKQSTLAIPSCPNTTNGLSLNINIELHLPATQDGEVYDKLFEALKKHLLQG